MVNSLGEGCIEFAALARGGHMHRYYTAGNAARGSCLRLALAHTGELTASEGSVEA